VKRNKDLIFQLLDIWINAKEIGSLTAQDLFTRTNRKALGPYRLDEIQYHLRLMNDIGLIEYANTGAGDTLRRVTWAGYDYYEAAIYV